VHRRRQLGAPIPATGVREVSARLSKKLLDKKPHILLVKEDSVEVVRTMLEVLEELVSEGERVSLPTFGSFEPIDKQARTSRNPRTGEEIHTEAKVVPRFRPAKAFKDKVHDALKQRLNSE